MHTLKKLIALAAGAVIALCASMTADAASYKYDYNMDGVSDGDDLQALGDYLLGRDTLEKDAYDSGDLNGDDKVGILDVIILNKNLMIGTPLDTSAVDAADALKDGVINETDSLTILKYVVELIPSLPLIP